MKEYSGYEVINIPASDIDLSKVKYVESDWMVVIDGPSKIAQEVNRKTGETRPYDFDRAMREMLG